MDQVYLIMTTEVLIAVCTALGGVIAGALVKTGVDRRRGGGNQTWLAAMEPMIEQLLQSQEADRESRAAAMVRMQELTNAMVELRLDLARDRGLREGGR